MFEHQSHLWLLYEPISVCRCSKQPCTNSPQAHFPFKGLRRGNCCACLSAKAGIPFLYSVFSVFCISHRLSGEDSERRYTLGIMVHFSLQGRLGAVPALTPCIQDTEPRETPSRCSCRHDDTGMDYSAKRPNLAPNNSPLFHWTSPAVFTSSSSKFEKTQLNRMGLSETHFLYQGQRIKELNKTALYETKKTKSKTER